MSNQRGFSLPGIVVAAGMLGILATGMAMLFSDMTKQQNTVRFKSEGTTFREDVRNLLKSPQACFNTFRHLPLTSPSSHTVSSIRNADLPAPGTERFKLNEPYGGGSLKINKIYFNYVDDPAGGGAGRAVLTLEVIAAKSVIGYEYQRLEINVKTMRSGTTMTSCAVTGGETLWVRESTNPANIFYDEGNVGVGLIAPTAKFEVAGDMVSTGINNGGSRDIDWSRSNVQSSTAGCTGANWNFSNMKNGGSYTLAVKQGTHSGQCRFTNSGVSDWRFRPPNAEPASGYVIYTFLRMENTVFVVWVDGF